MHGTRLDIATRGWELPGWVGDFYPEDLPPEWRMTYFSNEFPAVLVPCGLWSAAGADRLNSWACDVHRDFRLYLELPSTAGPYDLRAEFSDLGGKLAGFVGTAEAGGNLPAAYYRWRDDVRMSRAGEYAAYRAPAPETDLRASRFFLESVARHQKGAPALILVDGARIGAEGLRHWLHLAWLLGVA